MTACTKRHVADTLPLAFLAPALVRAVIEARLPRGISTRSIAEPELECHANGPRERASPGASPRRHSEHLIRADGYKVRVQREGEGGSKPPSACSRPSTWGPAGAKLLTSHAIVAAPL